MAKLKHDTPSGFVEPTMLPRSKEEAAEWQEANYAWWETHPMRYDWKEKLPHAEFSKEFFLEIDRRFFSNAKEYLLWREIPFDTLIDFGSLKKKDVLEIGVGNSSHAQILAQHSKSFTGIDITDYAIKSNLQRFNIFNLQGKILKMDAEKLAFPDGSFDFVWSWGVIHHSSNTERILKEIWRVLRPGGEAIIMVYHRGWWNYYFTELVRGIVSGELLKTSSLHTSAQLHTDGALARYYKISGWRALVKNLFAVEWIKIMGPKTDVILLPEKLKAIVMKIIPNNVNKFFTNRLKMGSFLVSKLKKLS